MYNVQTEIEFYTNISTTIIIKNIEIKVNTNKFTYEILSLFSASSPPPPMNNFLLIISLTLLNLITTKLWERISCC